MRISDTLKQQQDDRDTRSRYTRLLLKDDPADAAEVQQLGQKLGRSLDEIRSDQAEFLKAARELQNPPAGASAAPQPPPDFSKMNPSQLIEYGLQHSQPVSAGVKPMQQPAQSNTAELPAFERLNRGLEKLQPPDLSHLSPVQLIELGMK